MIINTKSLTAAGISLFEKWLENPEGSIPPPELLQDELFTELYGDLQIDTSKEFHSRCDFGNYLNEQFMSHDAKLLLAPESDGLWAWLALIYFQQLTLKGIRRKEHYIVTRKGSAGSLAYRHGVRTSYELCHIHGISAEICLNRPMHTHGELTEQLTSRQTIAHNRAFFHAAHKLYINDGQLKRGASSKPKKPKDRMLGDRTGFGGVRRLAIALQRLDLTYDTDGMAPQNLVELLPKEFGKYAGAE